MEKEIQFIPHHQLPCAHNKNGGVAFFFQFLDIVAAGMDWHQSHCDIILAVHAYIFLEHPNLAS